MRDVLIATLFEGGNAPHGLGAAVGHATAFMTWYSLVRDQRLDDAEAIEVVVALVNCMAVSTGAAS